MNSHVDTIKQDEDHELDEKVGPYHSELIIQISQTTAKRGRERQHTMLLISASAKDSPSQSMLQTSLVKTQEMRIAAEGVLFFSFTINCC